VKRCKVTSVIYYDWLSYVTSSHLGKERSWNRSFEARKARREVRFVSLSPDKKTKTKRQRQGRETDENEEETHIASFESPRHSVLLVSSKKAAM
jgi:hypothetical protein